MFLTKVNKVFILWTFVLVTLLKNSGHYRTTYARTSTRVCSVALITRCEKTCTHLTVLDFFFCTSVIAVKNTGHLHQAFFRVQSPESRVQSPGSRVHGPLQLLGYTLLSLFIIPLFREVIKLIEQ